MAIERLNLEQQIRYDNIMSGITKKCKNCGHATIISAKVDHILCSWCGRYVFRTPLDEFKYRFKEKNINLANK